MFENAGFEAAPHMLLYYFNFGFTLMETQTEICFPMGSLKLREADLPLEVVGYGSRPKRLTGNGFITMRTLPPEPMGLPK